MDCAFAPLPAFAVYGDAALFGITPEDLLNISHQIVPETPMKSWVDTSSFDPENSLAYFDTSELAFVNNYFDFAQQNHTFPGVEDLFYQHSPVSPPDSAYSSSFSSFSPDSKTSSDFNSPAWCSDQLFPPTPTITSLQADFCFDNLLIDPMTKTETFFEPILPEIKFESECADGSKSPATYPPLEVEDVFAFQHVEVEDGSLEVEDGTAKQKYMCPFPHICGRTEPFDRKWNYEQHLHTYKHDPHRPKNFRCLRCNADFARLYDLLRHEFSVHDKMRPFKCEKCKKSFARKDAMKRHQSSPRGCLGA